MSLKIFSPLDRPIKSHLKTVSAALSANHGTTLLWILWFRLRFILCVCTGYNIFMKINTNPAKAENKMFRFDIPLAQYKNWKVLLVKRPSFCNKIPCLLFVLCNYFTWTCCWYYCHCVCDIYHLWKTIMYTITTFKTSIRTESQHKFLM